MPVRDHWDDRCRPSGWHCAACDRRGCVRIVPWRSSPQMHERAGVRSRSGRLLLVFRRGICGGGLCCLADHDARLSRRASSGAGGACARGSSDRDFSMRCGAAGSPSISSLATAMRTWSATATSRRRIQRYPTSGGIPRRHAPRLDTHRAVRLRRSLLQTSQGVPGCPADPGAVSGAAIRRFLVGGALSWARSTAIRLPCSASREPRRRSV